MTINFPRPPDLQTRILSSKASSPSWIKIISLSSRNCFQNVTYICALIFIDSTKVFKGIYLILTTKFKVEFLWKNVITENRQLMRSYKSFFLSVFLLKLCYSKESLLIYMSCGGKDWCVANNSPRTLFNDNLNNSK